MSRLEMVCPKCASPMVSFERNGVTVEQCSGCRGIFLDRGELEQLIDAEAQFLDSKSFDGRASSWPLSGTRSSREHGDGRHGSGHGQDGRRSRRRGFLGDLFD